MASSASIRSPTLRPSSSIVHHFVPGPQNEHENLALEVLGDVGVVDGDLRVHESGGHLRDGFEGPSTVGLRRASGQPVAGAVRLARRFAAIGRWRRRP